MKTTSLLLSSLLCLSALSASAHPFDETDPAQQYEVHAAHRAVHQDYREIEAEKRNLAHDKNVAKIEARDVEAVERRQDELAARGDLRGAQRLERARYHEINEAKIARRQVSHDRNVIKIKHRELDHDERVLDNARGNR